jgi:hypothetical protein
MVDLDGLDASAVCDCGNREDVSLLLGLEANDLLSEAIDHVVPREGSQVKSGD